MILTKRELLRALEQVGDDDFVMVQLGGHAGKSCPIIGVEDSTSIGFWEIRADPDEDFWKALSMYEKNREL